MPKTIASHSKKTFYQTGIFLYFLSFIGSILSPALTYCGYLQLSRRIFIFSLCISLVAIISLFVSRSMISENVKMQMFSCYTILAVIFTPIFIRSFIDKYAHYSIFHWIECIVLYCGLLFWFLIIKEKKARFYNMIYWLKNHKMLLCILGIVFFLSLEQLTKGLKWDTIHYYAYITRLKEFTFNPNDIMMFRASGHACYAYVLIYSIGEAFSPGNGYGVRLQTIFIFIVSIVLLYKVLEVILPKGKKQWRLFTVAIYSVTPVILGPIHNIDVEILLLTLFIALFYFYITKQYIVFLLLSLFLVFAKETCVLLLMGFLIFEAFRLLPLIKNIYNLIDCFKMNIFKYLSFYIPLFAFLVYFCVGPTWGSADSGEKIQLFNTWGINGIVILNKLKQLYMMNFAWLTSLMIIFAAIHYLSVRRAPIKERENSIFLLLGICYGIFLLTQLLYITYTFPRYIMLQYFFAAIVFQEALNYLPIKNAIKSIACSATLLLTLTQNFYPLDIVSKRIFNTMDIGNTEIIVNSPIIYLNNKTILTGKEAEFLELSPYAEMNRQWSYFDELINTFLSEINYTHGDLILYPDTFYPRSHNIFFGMWSETYFNKESRRLQQIVSSEIDTSSNAMAYYNAKIITDNNINIEEYKRVYYLEFPYNPSYDNSILDEYTTLEKTNISYRGWSLEAYKIKE